eukprot:m.38594 g.38594  ORF g.38594 m.38594 type:complete len:189 (-) comp5514_c0_seq2:197-763(-)
MENLQALAAEKARLEKAINDTVLQLGQLGVSMDESLVDSEDYPRGDIDVHAARMSRSELRRLRSDYKDVLAKIEAGLAAVHAASKREETGAGPAPMSPSTPAVLPAFLVVGPVTALSPAAEAGLQSGDKIVRFGSINAGNFAGMGTIADLVRHSEGVRATHVLARCNSMNPTAACFKLPDARNRSCCL